MAQTDWEKRKAFAKEYAASGNGTQAAVAAGVPEKSAHAVAYKWLKNPDITALVRDELDARMKQLGPVALDVIRDIMLDPNVSPQTRLTAARDTLDRLGWVPPKRGEMVANITNQPNLDEMTDAELMAIIQRGKALSEIEPIF